MSDEEAAEILSRALQDPRPGLKLLQRAIRGGFGLYQLTWKEKMVISFYRLFGLKRRADKIITKAILRDCEVRYKV